MLTPAHKSLVFGISGASGMPLAWGALRSLAEIGSLAVHLVISQGAERVMQHEGGAQPEELHRLAAASYDAANLAAPPASGTWPALGMIVCPCSMSTLAHVANGTGHNLLHRAADVTLKERRPLILVVRETPLNLVHIKNMQAATEAGAIVMPFCPAFYAGLEGMDQMIRYFTGRMLDQLRVPHQLCGRRWGEDF